MDTSSLQAQVKSLEVQLQVLRAQLATVSQKEDAPPMSALRGLLKSTGDFTEEEIRAARFSSL